MRAPTKLSLCALFCLATALGVSAEIYFEENFPDGMYLLLLFVANGLNRRQRQCLFDVIIVA